MCIEDEGEMGGVVCSVQPGGSRNGVEEKEREKRGIQLISFFLCVEKGTCFYPKVGREIVGKPSGKNRDGRVAERSVSVCARDVCSKQIYVAVDGRG